jgi:hypothetical protein
MSIAALFCDVFSLPTIWGHYGLSAAEHHDILTWMSDHKLFEVTEEVRSRHDALVKELRNCSADSLMKETTALKKNHAHANALADWDKMFKIIRKKHGSSFDSKYFQLLREHKLDAIRRLTKRSLKSNKPGDEDTGQPLLLASINSDPDTSSSSEGSDTGDERKITAGTLLEVEKDILASWLYGVEKGFKKKRGQSTRIATLDIFSDAVFRTAWDKDCRRQARLTLLLEQKMKEADVFWTSEYLSVEEEKPLMPYTSSMVRPSTA